MKNQIDLFVVMLREYAYPSSMTPNQQLGALILAYSQMSDKMERCCNGQTPLAYAAQQMQKVSEANKSLFRALLEFMMTVPGVTEEEKAKVTLPPYQENTVQTSSQLVSKCMLEVVFEVQTFNARQWADYVGFILHFSQGLKQKDWEGNDNFLSCLAITLKERLQYKDIDPQKYVLNYSSPQGQEAWPYVRALLEYGFAKANAFGGKAVVQAQKAYATLNEASHLPEATGWMKGDIQRLSKRYPECTKPLPMSPCAKISSAAVAVSVVTAMAAYALSSM